MRFHAEGKEMKKGEECGPQAQVLRLPLHRPVASFRQWLFNVAMKVESTTA